MKNKVILTIVTIASVLSLSACAGLTKPPAASAGNTGTIGANGIGEVYIVPDIAYINIGVRVDADDVSDALAKNNALANKISAALQAQGVEKADIQTSSFNVYPMSDYGMDGQVTRQYYVVENTVLVTARDLDKLGTLLDTAVRSGANSIYGINFDVSNRSAAQAEARNLAIANAQAEAKAIAEAAGVQLGALQSVSVNTGGVASPYYDGRGGGMAMDSSVPVAAGQLKISVNANVVYGIK